MEKDKKNILKNVLKDKLPLRRGSVGEDFNKYPILRNAQDSVDEKFPYRRSNGNLLTELGDEKDGFGSKLEDPNFIKALKRFQEKNKITGLV